MTPGEMRDHVFRRDGHVCQWPGCDIEISPINPLECAHLNHRGMGGNVKANHPSNGVALCKFHHDVFDGRQGQGKTRTELAGMLKAVVGLA